MMRLIYKLLATAIGVLGLAGCSAKTADEYGQPYATYHLDGQVVTAKEKQPVVGVEIRFELMGNAFTDTAGFWQLGGRGNWWPERCTLLVHDVDGDSSGGKFQDKKVPLTLTKTADRGSCKWDEGTYEQHDILIELDPNSTK